MFHRELEPGKVALRLVCAFLLSFMGAVNGLFVIGCMLVKWASEIISSERPEHALARHLLTYMQMQMQGGAFLCDYRKLEKSEISLEVHIRQKTRCFPSWGVGICFSSWAAFLWPFPEWLLSVCFMHVCCWRYELSASCSSHACSLLLDLSTIKDSPYGTIIPNKLSLVVN